MFLSWEQHVERGVLVIITNWHCEYALACVIREVDVLQLRGGVPIVGEGEVTPAGTRVIEIGFHVFNHCHLGKCDACETI